jgi:hypothetical protein
MQRPCQFSSAAGAELVGVGDIDAVSNNLQQFGQTVWRQICYMPQG